MNRLRHTYYILLALLGIVSCSEETNVISPSDDYDPIMLKGINAVIVNGDDTRAVSPLVDSIGKYSFLATDEIIFTKIARTKRPIPGFSYEGVKYSCEINGGNTSWKRQNPTDDIFWSDGSQPHTFIGYILPHVDNEMAAETNFDWNHDSDHDVYYGSIGDPTQTENDSIDYTCEPGDDIKDPYNLEKLRKEDLLLTYDTEMQNVDAMAQVHFHHGLASVRVVVTITGFSATGNDPDAQTKVTSMVLHKQPTMYKWDNKSFKTAPLTLEDQTVLDGFWTNNNIPKWNQTKEMKLWQPREHHGSGASRTFTFYGITAPGFQDKVDMTFSVSYPDPLDPNHENPHRLEKQYTATLQLADDKKVEFRPGYCTSITVNLNHKDEKMTVGAEYMSWQNEDNPDEGSLRKNTTYLSYTDRDKITIVGDPKATADDATWLYADANGTILDIYGNNGSASKPYLICTADQLLSFAYEVKQGRDFIHKFIKLDADITMQPKKDDTKTVSWIGIGDATHVFNGFFLGSGRFINNLYGAHFFHTIGDNAVIDKLNFSNVLEVQGSGVIAHQNRGLICGCFIDGDVKETESTADYTGSVVGTNNSFIIACAHVGKVAGQKTVGGLVGFNNGTVMASYHCGEITGEGTNPDVHATVGKRGNGEGGTNNSIMFSCYFDQSLISHTPTLEPSKSGYPFTTSIMQSNAFVNAEKTFVFDSDGSYTKETAGQSLKEVLLAILEDGAASLTNPTEAELMRKLVDEGMTGKVNEVFAYHFSLNEALRAFRLWLNAIAEKSDDKVKTNCHEFTREQIEFLKTHYTTEHRFVYVPASYPKVQ